MSKEQAVAALDAAHASYQQAVAQLAQALEVMDLQVSADALQAVAKQTLSMIHIRREQYINPPACVIVEFDEDDEDPHWERTF